MIFNKILFFAVPFDNSYRDVFSAIDTDGTFIGDFKSKLYDFLWEHYLSYGIDLPSVKSVRRDELYCSFNIQVPSYVPVGDYNYVITENSTNGELEFWFINRYYTENNANGINVNLALELDVWSTYQNLIYNETRLQLVEQMHIKQVENRNGAVRVIDNLQVYDDQEPLSDYEEIPYYSSEYDILWAQVQRSGKLVYLDKDDNIISDAESHWNSPNSSYIYSSETFDTLFVPVAIFRKYNADFSLDENVIPTCIIRDKFDVEHTLRGGLDFSHVTSDIVSIRYTFNPPILYTVTKQGKVLYVKLKNAIFAHIIQSPESTSEFFDAYISDNSKTNIDLVHTFNSNYIYTTFDASHVDYQDSGYFDIEKFINTNPLCHRYPYEKVRIQVGQSLNYEIVPKFYDEKFSVKMSPSCEGVRVIFEGGHGNNNYYDSKIIPSLSLIDSSLPFSVSQISDYLRNNGYKLATAKSEEIANIQLSLEGAKAQGRKALVSMSSDFYGGMFGVANAYGNKKYLPNKRRGSLVGGFLSATETGLSADIDMEYAIKQSEVNTSLVEKRYSAQLKDLKNAKDIVTLSSGGENDTLIQDRIIVRREKMSIENITCENYDTLFRLHLFGFRLNKYMDIRKFPMNSFVYLKTVSSSLSSYMNNVIRHKLEEILDNGVRCWRLTSNNLEVVYMNYFCANYQNLEAN